MNSYSKIELMQIEKNDLPEMKVLANQLRNYLAEHRELSLELLNDRYENYVNNMASYHLSIRGLREGGFGLDILGFCSVVNVDWISKHAELNIIMYGDGKTHGTIPSGPIGIMALDKILNLCFDELNLEKVWIEVISGNDIKSSLEQLGFVAEGIRRNARIKYSKIVSSTICSVLRQEYKENKS